MLNVLAGVFLALSGVVLGLWWTTRVNASTLDSMGNKSGWRF